MSSSAITTQLAQLKVGNVQNQADSSSVYSAGVWSFKNSTAVTSVTITDAGNVGIGVAPSAWSSIFKALHIGNGGGSLVATTIANDEQIQLCSNLYYDGTAYKYVVSAHASRYVQNNGAHEWFTAPSGTAGNSVTETLAMRIDSSGNVGIGMTPNGAVALDVKEPDAGQDLILGLTAGTGARAQIRSIAQPDNTSSVIAFSTGSAGSTAERMRINASGDLLVATTSTSTTAPGFRVYNNNGEPYVFSNRTDSTNAASTFNVYSTGAGAYRFYVGFGGTIYATNTTISSLSDQRLKENIEDLDIGLNTILSLRPRKFDWKTGKGKNIKGDRGFIAQEFEKIFPDLIDEWKDPAPEGEEPYKTVRQDLIPVLVKAIQELSAKVDAQAEEIKALKAQP